MPETHDQPRGNSHVVADGRVPQVGTFLRRARFDADDPVALGTMLAELIDYGFHRLPVPGRGRTLERWQSLAPVAACDLGLAKLFEGHTDALAREPTAARAACRRDHRAPQTDFDGHRLKRVF